MSRSTLVLLIILVLILVVAGWFAYLSLMKRGTQNQPISAAQMALGSTSSSVEYTDFYGNSVVLESAGHELLVVHSWATWVPSSSKSLSSLSTLQETYREKGVEIVAMNRSESPATAAAFLGRMDLQGLKIVNDSSDSFYKAIDGKTMPETIIFSREGDILFHIKKPLTLTELDSYIDRALKQNVEIKN